LHTSDVALRQKALASCLFLITCARFKLTTLSFLV